MRKSVGLCTLLFLMLPLTSCGAPSEVDPVVSDDVSLAYTGTVTIALDDTTLSMDEPIIFMLEASEELPEDAWVGVVPSSTPHNDEAAADRADVAYIYVRNMEEGQATLGPITRAGSYDLRVYTSDSGGQEVASESFVITEDSTTSNATTVIENDPLSSFQLLSEVSTDAYTILLDKTTFAPGETFEVLVTTSDPSFTSSAWIGIVPADIQHGDEHLNDTNVISYEYLDGDESILSFTAPQAEGRYDLRLHDTDSLGKEMGFIQFEVK